MTRMILTVWRRCPILRRPSHPGRFLSHTDDDGERETRVAKRLIKKKGGSRSPSPKRGRDKLREGAKVSARYRGRSKYYPGRIERDRGDGTYDIFYDDGERETRVAKDLIKSLDSGSDRSRSRSRSPSRGRLRVGTRVEARYRGKSRYYPGKISRVRADGTFDVSYDDGESETRVLAEYIKSSGGGGSSRDDSRSPRGRRGSRLSEGDSIEARYRTRRRGS